MKYKVRIPPKNGVVPPPDDLTEEEKGFVKEIEARKLEGMVADLTIKSEKVIRARRELYGVSKETGSADIPNWASHVLRCPSCHKFSLFHKGVPFAEQGLGQKSCKGCGKDLPFADSTHRKFSDKVVFTLDQDVDSYIARMGW